MCIKTNSFIFICVKPIEIVYICSIMFQYSNIVFVVLVVVTVTRSFLDQAFLPGQGGCLVPGGSTHETPLLCFGCIGRAVHRLAGCLVYCAQTFANRGAQAGLPWIPKAHQRMSRLMQTWVDSIPPKVHMTVAVAGALTMARTSWFGLGLA